MSKKPEPKVVQQVCSVCGLDWKTHTGLGMVTLETCVHALKKELHSARSRTSSQRLSASAMWQPIVTTGGH